MRVLLVLVLLLLLLLLLLLVLMEGPTPSQPTRPRHSTESCTARSTMTGLPVVMLFKHNSIQSCSAFFLKPRLCTLRRRPPLRRLVVNTFVLINSSLHRNLNRHCDPQGRDKSNGGSLRSCRPALAPYARAFSLYLQPVDNDRGIICLLFPVFHPSPN